MSDELLHHLWTKAVGTPGYDKSEWKALERLWSVVAMIRDDFDRAIREHDQTDPRHRSHGGQHHNGPCCEFGNVTPGAVRHMRRLRDAIDAALDTTEGK